MKIIITENQYSKLLSEQQVYTSETEYNNAIKVYEKKMSFYYLSQKVKQKLDLAYNKTSVKYYKLGTLDSLIEHYGLDMNDSDQDYKTLANSYKTIKSLGLNFKIISYLFWFSMTVSKRWYIDEKIKYQISYNDFKNQKRVRPKTTKPVYEHMLFVFSIDKPEKPILKKPVIIKKESPIIPPAKKPEEVKTDFSATFGQDGKQETRYFKNFDEWKRFHNTNSGKFGYITGETNNANSYGRSLLKGTPEDWGL
jgi:hypothetical protein